jgi:F420-non-reducing hydrogenase iron-sulfur subunit
VTPQGIPANRGLTPPDKDMNSNTHADAALPVSTKSSPGVVVFRCAAALSETASSNGTPKPTVSTHEVLVPCAGKLQPEHFLKAFERGADFVLVATCRDGECRYLEGDLRVRRRVDHVKTILDDIGLGGRRIALVEAPHERQDSAIADAIAAGLAGLEASPLSRNGDEEGS